MSLRDTEVDIAYTLLACPDVAAVWAFDLAKEDEYRYAVEMSPYTITSVVQAHYTLLGAADRSTTGGVLYFAGERSPAFIEKRGRRLRIKDHEWFGARRREQIREETRAANDEKQRQDERERFKAALGEGSLDQAPVASSAKSGVFRVLEITPDPFRPRPKPSFPVEKPNHKGAFPPPRARSARVLVIDDRESTTEAVARVPYDIDVVPTSDGWTALERIKRERFDLIVCAVRFGEWSGKDLVRMACTGRPELRSRFVFLADARAVADLAPQSNRSRVLARPLDAQKLLALIDETRGAKGEPLA